MLTRLLQSDPALSGIDLVIFDEFHERSLHADLGLALTRDAQQTLRDDLKILVMSATLDTSLTMSTLIMLRRSSGIVNTINTYTYAVKHRAN